VLEPDVDQPRDLRRRHVQARKFEKHTAEAKGVEIDRSGESDHGQTSFQRLPNYRGANGSNILAPDWLSSAEFLWRTSSVPFGSASVGEGSHGRPITELEPAMQIQAAKRSRAPPRDCRRSTRLALSLVTDGRYQPKNEKDRYGGLVAGIAGMYFQCTQASKRPTQRRPSESEYKAGYAD
jgi:hypothetical protein